MKFSDFFARRQEAQEQKAFREKPIMMKRHTESKEMLSVMSDILKSLMRIKGDMIVI
ncbi:Uncharacterised protein [Helicobacter cinaedi]|uniref:Uncharacterized protein n=1 Tax=Helicobacter cinaedi TaxID=213 RepID=A0A377JWP0_9HELI|nr:hypothetical protein [Helicobacter cinaedi]STP14273.1 Uncharacterised protein [Helicobacter cinaedi]